MARRNLIQAVVACGMICLCTMAKAEYYVVNPEVPYDEEYFHIYSHKHRVKHKVTPQKAVHHAYRRRVHRYYDSWYIKHRHCYDPDLATGDDDPCIYPDMDVDE